MTIVPDTKDWTWVLERTCPECGYDAGEVAAGEVAALVRGNTRAWSELLTTRHDVRTRPSEDRWSPLEYGCHVRDVHLLAAKRVTWMLEEDDPTFPNWDQDTTAVEDDYPAQDPLTVAGELLAAGSAFAHLLDSVEGASWERQGLRGDGRRFTIATYARYVFHDPFHHLVDVS